METLISLSQGCDMPVLLLLVHSFSFTSAGGHPVMQGAGLPPAAASSAPWSISLCSYRSNSLGIRWEVNWCFSSAVVPEEGSTGSRIHRSPRSTYMSVKGSIQTHSPDHHRKIWRDYVFAQVICGVFCCAFVWLGFFCFVLGLFLIWWGFFVGWVFLTQKAFHGFSWGPHSWWFLTLHSSHTQKTQAHIHSAGLETAGLLPTYFKTSILCTGQCHLSD